MRIDHSRRGKETRLRNTPHSNLAGVARNILDEPFDGVVTVGAFVGIFWTLNRLLRPDDCEVALAHKTTTNILISKNEFLSSEQLRRTKRGSVFVDSVGRNVIGRTLKHDRIGLAIGRDILGHIDRREEFHSIAHRYSKLVFRIVFAHERGAGRDRWQDL